MLVCAWRARIAALILFFSFAFFFFALLYDKPCRAQRDGVELVCCEAVPHEQLAVLRRAHKVVRVRRPLHRVDLRQVALERASDLQLVVLGDRRKVMCVLVDCLFGLAFWVLVALSLCVRVLEV